MRSWPPWSRLDHRSIGTIVSQRAEDLGMEFLTTFESTIRASIFFVLLAGFAIIEAVFPRRARVQNRIRRWLTNGSLVVIGTLTLRFFLPIAAMGMAALADERGLGLLNLTNWPIWVEIVVALIVLDMAIYWQHVAMHRVPILWRFHQVHHADRDIDVSTGVRFHPIEIVVSMIFKMVCVLALGVPVAAVLVFEIVLNACAMFNHANINLGVGVDRILRCLLVTPDMHRVHHSAVPEETNRNFGFSIALWDRLFGTYLAQPQAGHLNMTIGLEGFQREGPERLSWSLLRPLRRQWTGN